MSNYQPKDLTGSLFRNDRKEKDNHPDYTGSVLIDGVEYWQSAWVKESNTGKKFFSQSFKRKEERRDAPASAPRRETIDDDIPF